MEVISSIQKITGIEKLKRLSLQIDSFFCFLHYRVTVFLFVICAVIISSKQFVGNPIRCISFENFDKDVTEYCWFKSVYKLDEEDFDKQYYSKEKTFFLFFPWVSLVLLIQALFFYLPRYLWKKTEGNRISSYISYVKTKKKEDEKQPNHADDLFLLRLYSRNFGFQYFFCEVLNFVNIIAQIFITNYCFQNKFLRFGPDMIHYYYSKGEKNPAENIFPTRLNCEFSRRGINGGLVEHDLLCLIAINVVNEKIYILIWFWFAFLFFLTALRIVYLIVILFSATVRRVVLQLNSHFPYDYEPVLFKDLKEKIDFNDFFFIFFICQNSDLHFYHDLLYDIVKKDKVKGEKEKTIV